MGALPPVLTTARHSFLTSEIIMISGAKTAASQYGGKSLFCKASEGSNLSKMHYLFSKEYVRKLTIGKCNLGVLMKVSGKRRAACCLPGAVGRESQ